MAGDTRVGDRQPAILRIKLKYPTVETFIEKYAVNISRGGIFIASRTPKPVGTLIKFEFLLQSGETGVSIIRGEGQVQWVREFDPAAPNRPHGMGLRFTQLDGESQKVIDRALAWQQQHIAPIRRELSGVGRLPTSEGSALNRLPPKDASAPHPMPVAPASAAEGKDASAPHPLPAPLASAAEIKDASAPHPMPVAPASAAEGKDASAPHPMPPAPVDAAPPPAPASAPPAVPAAWPAQLDAIASPPTTAPPAGTLGRVALRRVAVSRADLPALRKGGPLPASATVPVDAAPQPAPADMLARLCDEAGLSDSDLDLALQRLRALGVPADTDLAELLS